LPGGKVIGTVVVAEPPPPPEIVVVVVVGIIEVVVVVMAWAFSLGIKRKTKRIERIKNILKICFFLITTPFLMII